MVKCKFQYAAALLIALACTAPVLAWGPEGHRIVGVEAVELLSPAARAELTGILGGDSGAVVGQACNWPDTIRETAQGRSSDPLHYVNLPRHADSYDRQRDCPDGLCVTEGIIRFAAELGQPGIGQQRRWQAFAWLCHLVGDLHQPLHAAFRDDRGGNQVTVEYGGQRYNLHEFWDSILVEERLGPGYRWTRPPTEQARTRESPRWDPTDVADWTAESHRIAASRSYPPQPQIDAEFADQGWLLIRQQWQKAAHRLASILNTVLGPEDSG
jgi:hypothetical protein